MNYFEIFGLRPAFNINAEDLQTQFYKLSRTLHPDRFHTAPPEELARATEKFAEINNAFRTLVSEEERAEYLFSLAGFNPKSSNKNQLPPGLAEDYFTLQEVLEDAGLNADQRRSEIEKFSGLIQKELSASESNLKAAMSEWENAGAPLDDRAHRFFERASSEIRQKAYLRSMSQDLEKRCRT